MYPVYEALAMWAEARFIGIANLVRGPQLHHNGPRWSLSSESAKKFFFPLGTAEI